MLLLVGLGNPGSAHANQRHNAGFMAAEEIARSHDFGAPRSKFRGRLYSGELGGAKTLILCPDTFMNRSGFAVAEAVGFYKIPLDKVVVLHDEIDLASGKLKVKSGGGAAGHNGLRSISEHIGKDYRRVRIGVGHPGHKDAVHGHVLHDFSKADTKWLEPLLQAISDAAPLLATGEDGKFMTKVALLIKPPKKKTKDTPDGL